LELKRFNRRRQQTANTGSGAFFLSESGTAIHQRIAQKLLTFDRASHFLSSLWY
jgi:hypothetical protein